MGAVYPLGGHYGTESETEEWLDEWTDDWDALGTGATIEVELCGETLVPAGATGTFRIRVGGTSGSVDGTIAGEITANTTSLDQKKDERTITRPSGQALIKLTALTSDSAKKAELDGVVFRAGRTNLGVGGVVAGGGRGLPNLEKEWQADPNIAISQATIGDSHLGLMLALVNSFVGFSENPITVVSSSNSVVAGAANHWGSIADLVNDDPGSAHSWMLLQNAMGRQLLLSLNSAASKTICTAKMSVSGGFTGGSITADPTASDAVTVLFDSYGYGHDGGGGVTDATTAWGTIKLTVLHSTDGKNTQAYAFQDDNPNIGAGDRPLYPMILFFQWGEVSQPCSGWDDPCVCVMRGNGRILDSNDGNIGSIYWIWDGNISFSPSAVEGYPIKAYGPEGQMDCLITLNSVAGTAIADTDYWTPDVTQGIAQISGKQPIQTVGVFCVTDGMREYVGNLMDFWLCGPMVDNHTTPDDTGLHATRSTIPSDDSKQFVKVGDWLIPWDGETDLEIG